MGTLTVFSKGFTMISGYRPQTKDEPMHGKQVQWGPAVGAGLIAGFVLVIVPRGSPWSSLTFFQPTIMGRSLATSTTPLILAWLVHLAVSVVYGLFISRVLVSFAFRRALLTGALLGLILYVINFGVVSLFWHGYRGNELLVVFTHIVFGLICAGAYRGLLRRRVVAA